MPVLPFFAHRHFREFVQNNLSPLMLAQAIAERSGREQSSEVLSFS